MSNLLSWSTRLVVLIPFLAALLGLSVARRRFASAVVAVTGGVLTLLAAAYVLFGVHHGPFTPEVSTIGALPLGRLQMPLHLLLDDLSAIVVVAVAIVGLAIQIFTKWYLHDDVRYGAFTASVSLFLAGMFLVVLSGDLVLTLVGWEVMGWCSYLLIGHNSRLESARRAALKAFLVTRTADLAFVIGLIILATGAETTSIPALLTTWAGMPGATLTAAFLCLLSGIAGKSAQFPFHDWLPDAMEGPTPASALIHAATMVAAGTFVLARLFPIFVLSDPARLVLAVITAVTMIGSAILAFGQSDIKRLLAYSTDQPDRDHALRPRHCPGIHRRRPCGVVPAVARDVQGLALPRGRVAQRAGCRHLGREDVRWRATSFGAEGAPRHRLPGAGRSSAPGGLRGQRVRSWCGPRQRLRVRFGCRVDRPGGSGDERCAHRGVLHSCLAGPHPPQRRGGDHPGGRA